jgi:NitT/TauT family transport system substrate-binding protein
VKFFFIIFLSLIICAIISCASKAPQRPPDTVTLQLKWVHQAQFAGFYVAQEKGYYSRENIQINFLEGGPDIDIVQPVISGVADFGILSPDDILLSRSLGQPLTAISAIYRRSAVVFLSMADSGIKRPQDFMGKKIASLGSGGSNEFQKQLLAMIKELNLDPRGMEYLPYDSNYQTFLNGQVDITPAYATGGLIRLRQMGLKLNLIWPSDYGIRFYSDTLCAADRLVSANPALVTRFLRASLQGWQDAVEDYRSAVNVTLKYARDADPQLQAAMMEAMLPLIHTGEDHLGWMKPVVWQEMYDILNDQGFFARPFAINEAYSLRFLDAVYGSQP